MKRILERYGVPFAAIFVIVVIGLAAAIGILSNQRFYLPKGVPFLGSDFVDYTIDFSSAKAVVPGQGQTVAISGVTVGEIADVRLHNGRGRVAVKIQRKYADRIHEDASAALRPRTLLDDMIIELDPGSKGSPRLPIGGNIPAERTMTPVEFDEVLSEFDADTRQYLAILLQQGAKGLAGDGGKDFGRLLRGLENTTTYSARIAKALKVREAQIQRTVTNLRAVMDEIGKNQDALATFVSSGADAFDAIGDSSADLKQVLDKSPDALKKTEELLNTAGDLSEHLGNASKRLERPTAKLDDGFKQLISFMDAASPVLRDQVRPFARDAQAPLGKLKPAVDDIAAGAKNTSTGVEVLRNLFDGIAYKPGGDNLSALTLAGWLGHAGMSLTSMQDAAGAVGRALLYTDCNLVTIGNGQLRKDSPSARIILDLLGTATPSTVLPNGQTAQKYCTDNQPK
ncbi:MAG: MCE family protein [Solirubrobacteraceae bacterium]|nr:MCE family protein [Solirubrobacteraceae bacterium]